MYKSNNQGISDHNFDNLHSNLNIHMRSTCVGALKLGGRF